MAPTAVSHPSPAVEIDDIKAKIVHPGEVELEVTPKPPVADNFMYDFQYNHALPTIDVLGRDIPADIDATKEAEAITKQLVEALSSGDADAFTDLFLEYGKLRRNCRKSPLQTD